MRCNFSGTYFSAGTGSVRRVVSSIEKTEAEIKSEFEPQSCFVSHFLPKISSEHILVLSLTSPTNWSVYWFRAAMCILVVVGFLPSEQKGIPQPFWSVFSGHVAQKISIFLQHMARTSFQLGNTSFIRGGERHSRVILVLTCSTWKSPGACGMFYKALHK